MDYISSLEKKLETLVANRNIEIEAINIRIQNDVEQTKYRYEQEISSLTKNHKGFLEFLESQRKLFSPKNKQANLTISSQIQELKDKYEQKVSSLRNKEENAISYLENELLASMVGKVERKYSPRISSVENKIQRIRIREEIINQNVE